MSRYINYSKFVLIAVGTVIGSSGMAMLIAAIADAVFWSVYGYDVTESTGVQMAAHSCLSGITMGCTATTKLHGRCVVWKKLE